MDLPIVVEPGYEADDVLGTLAYQASQQGFKVKILSGDRDYFSWFSLTIGFVFSI
nr:hypothetical protein [Acaryochloris sp. CCMEE 5410]